MIFNTKNCLSLRRLYPLKDVIKTDGIRFIFINMLNEYKRLIVMLTRSV
jgi:hypothetical protein